MTKEQALKKMNKINLQLQKMDYMHEFTPEQEIKYQDLQREVYELSLFSDAME